MSHFCQYTNLYLTFAMTIKRYLTKDFALYEPSTPILLSNKESLKGTA